MFKHKKNNELGITLIALIVTIIVLLILAGISIMMLTGDNGILTRAGEARDETIIGQEKEQVELAYISAAMKKLGDDVTANELQDELDSMLGDTEETDETKKKTNVKQNSDNTINVLFRATQHNYNVNKGKVERDNRLEDGIYIGNVRMGGLYLSNWANENYNDYVDRLVPDNQKVENFFTHCQQKSVTNSEYLEAKESAEEIGIDESLIDWAYNNQGVSIQYVSMPKYKIELTSDNSADITIPYYYCITSTESNYSIDISPNIQFSEYFYRDAETDGLNLVSEGMILNPECASFRYLDSNQEIPNEVQLPFGMVLKQGKNSNDLVIEWQGRSFTYNELGDFINNNTKIVYNGKTVNIAEEYAGAKIVEMLGIANNSGNENHFNNAILAYKQFLEAKDGYGLSYNWPNGW